MSLREDSGDEYIDEDFPPVSCDTDGTTTDGCGSTGAPVPSCQVSNDCNVGVCVAEFSGNIGQFECRDVCIGSLDETQWCADASACCDAAAICDRGLCIAPDSSGDVSTSDASSETSDGEPPGGEASSSGGESSGDASGSSSGG